jgi:hypothetical protein
MRRTWLAWLRVTFAPMARALVLACACVVLAGCGDDRVVPVAAWTLRASTRAGEPDAGARAISLPAHVGGLVSREDAEYTLDAEVTLPPDLRGRDLTLAVVRLPARAWLRAGGAPMAPLDDPPAGYRSDGPQRWRIPAAASDAERLRLTLTLDHGWAQSEWLDTVPRLSATPSGDLRFVVIRAFNRLTAQNALGMAAFSAYLYLVIYLSDRRRVSYVWFALTGTFPLTYPLFELGWMQSLLGPREVALVGIGVSAGTVCNVYFTHAQFKLPAASRAWGYLMLPVVTGCALVKDPFRGTPVAAALTTALAAPAIGYQVVLLVRLSRARPRPVNLFTILVPWALLGLLALPDFIAWNGLGEILGGARTACLGISVIALLQTTALSREHTFALRHADDLAAERAARIEELELRNVEFGQLNVELRRQIAARSGHLAEALARIGNATLEAAKLSPGDWVDDRYHVVRLVGAGGGGAVYEVIRKVDGRHLALKVVRGVTSSQMLARFAREAQLVAQVHHENVVSIVDVEVATAGFLYLVMELVEGTSLRERKAEFGRRGWALAVLHQLAEGLAAIHAHGIVHRDLKPANVLVTPAATGAPVVKIADFGIASEIEAAETTASDPPRPTVQTVRTARTDVNGDAQEGAAPARALTETGVILGTPFYMAPELVDGAKNAQPASDVFSFGMIAYEVLSGSPPFLEPPAIRRMSGHSERCAPSIAFACAGLELELIDLVDRALSLAPEVRPSARELSEALEAALRLQRLRA